MARVLHKRYASVMPSLYCNTHQEVLTTVQRCGKIGAPNENDSHLHLLGSARWSKIDHK